MGGDITAYSDGPETGASFTITIPRAVPETKKRSATDTETPASEVVEETASSSSTYSSSHNEPVISGRFQEQYA
jgi:hypothetical protein